MAVSHSRDRKKISGGRVGKKRDKIKKELGREPTNTKIEKKQKVKQIRTEGGNHKNRVVYAMYANVLDPKTKKAKKTKLLTAEETPANRNFARRNIITKGAIVKTEMGTARVTSRPGQDGTVNAILVEEKKK